MANDRIVDIFIIGAIITAIVLKITNVITISWLWLLSPLWILFSIGFVLALIFLIMVVIELYINKKEK